MRPRFYVPDLTADTGDASLPEDEAEHLSRVLRLGVGAEVDVFNGVGGLWRAEVVAAGKRSASVRLIEPALAAVELALPVTLVISVLKADKMDDVVRDAVMLGVAAIQPVVSERAEISLSTIEKSERVARWQRIAVSSAKQCGRAVVPMVRPAVTFTNYLVQSAETTRLICVEPATQSDSRTVQAVEKPAAAHVIVGPEGGWTETELAAAIAAGAIPLSLGGRTLRADAAPIVALTALLTTWSEL